MKKTIDFMILMTINLMMIIVILIGCFVLMEKPGKTDEIAYSMQDKTSSIKYFKGSQGSLSILGIKSRVVSIYPIDSCGFVALQDTNSMYPAIKEGDYVCVEDYNSKTAIKEGDIIIFEWEGKKVVHRIVRITGDDLIVTKGDNNKSEDYPITRDEIVSIVRLVVVR